MNDAVVYLRRRGLRLEYLTVAWNAVEALVAMGSAIVAHSIALIGFGLDWVIESFAAVVVIWELRGVGEERERRALRLIALSFFALALYVVVEAVRDLKVGVEAKSSVVGIGLAIASLLAMPALGLDRRPHWGSSRLPGGGELKAYPTSGARRISVRP